MIQRELERETHIPLPCWNLEYSLGAKNSQLVAKYLENPIKTETKAKTIFESVSKVETSIVTSVGRFNSKVHPRFPFDLGEFQREAFHFLVFLLA